MPKVKEVKSNIEIRNAQIGFRNFSGKETQYNPKGRRVFSVFLEPEVGATLAKDGWNVKYRDPREEGDPPQIFLTVRVAYAKFPPRIVLIKGKVSKVDLDEEDVHQLDSAEIKKVDLTISPYNWEVGNKRGVTAYLKSMWVTIIPDPFEEDYSDVPYANKTSNLVEDEKEDWED